MANQRSRKILELARKAYQEESYVLVPNAQIDSDPESDGEYENTNLLLPPRAHAVLDFEEEFQPNQKFTVLNSVDIGMNITDNSESDSDKENEHTYDIYHVTADQENSPNGNQLASQENVNVSEKRKSDEPMNLSRKPPPPIRNKRTVGKSIPLPNTFYDWNKEQFGFPVTIAEDCFTSPDEVLSPFDYFNLFFDNDLFSMLVEQTNLYSEQLSEVSIQITKYDIMDFLAIELMMGLVQMPAYTDYWSSNMRYEKVASVMPLKKYQEIRKYLHFVDNEQIDNDRFFKIRPVIDHVRRNCSNIEQEVRQSVDEMMVPYKGTKAGSRRQYIKNKPKKWGFKLFVRCGVSGMVYDFIPYGKDDTFRDITFTDREEQFGLGGQVVIALSQTIPNPSCSVLYFDNFFCSPDLDHYLRDQKGIFSLGTLRANRLRGCQVESDKNLKAQGRGTFCQMVDNDKKVAIVKWFDNKSVLICSSYVDAYPVSTIKRYVKDKNNTGKTDISCPQLVKHYNKHMGGVDLAGMFVALYRTNFKTHRWYMAIFSQILDICVNNAWLLYRRNMKLLQPEEKTMNLKDFRGRVINSLLLRDRKKGRSSQESIHLPKTKIKLMFKPRPQEDVRYDQYAHFPIFASKGRCRHCSQGQTHISCQKCEIRLCLTSGRNCFFDFHIERSKIVSE